MKYVSHTKQSGISLVGFIFLLFVIGLVIGVVVKVAPTFIEYRSIGKAIISAKERGTTVRDIQIAFDKQAEVGYIDAITGKDLDITKNGEEFVVSFSYEKKIPLFGPLNLLMEYTGTTANPLAKKPAA
ncbi:MAG: DUF4845 domain-containing protein [Pseudomonadota bacterium]